MNKVLFYMGIFLLILPLGLKFFGDKKQQDFISKYEKEVENVEKIELQKCLEQAMEYNEKLYLTDEFHEEAYEEQLNLFGNGVMGSIEIPRINLKLPVYHGTEESILTNGIGHLKESSLPVKGKNTHSILTGHRGLPEAQLFTRLDEMELEDIFYLNICGEKLQYRVCEIEVIKPEDVDILEIRPGKSLVTLITCTPYGINTHRLVVTGEYFEEVKVEEVDVNPVSNRDLLFGLIPIVLTGVGITVRMRKRGD